MGFNVESFLQDDDPLGNLAQQGGVPPCMLNLGAKALSLLPSPALALIRMQVLQGRMAAEADIQAFIAWIRDTFGLQDIIDENGRLAFLSKFSLFGIELFALIAQVQGYIQALTAYGAALYADYQNLYNEIQEAKACIESYGKNLKGQTAGATGPQNQYVKDRLESELSYLNDTNAFINRADDLINRIDSELARRRRNPNLEPKFDSTVDTSGLIPLFAQPSQIVEQPKEIFRLSFGPPKTKKGQFILSVDGIYYDSQSNGLAPIFTEITRRKNELQNNIFWNFEQDPNLGGRGKGISSKEIKEYVNNILDINKINDSSLIRSYYDADNYLEQLIAQRNKRIYDLSSHIVDLEDDVTSSEADIFNLRQSLLSENAAFQQKINKRKKQIELAVVFGTTKYSPGKIPLNDFSYLSNRNILFDIEKQKKLTLDFDDVDGIILPISATYVSPPKDNVITEIDHLALSIIGEANILQSTSSYSGTDATILPASTKIITDRLVAVYNFLETYVELPSSQEFLLDNCITNNNLLNGKLISSSIESVFNKGLGIPYLNGIVKLNSTGDIIGLNNSVVLNEAKQLNDLMYSKQGATIDFWIHASSIIPSSTGGVQQQYQIILANENFGLQEGVSAQPDLNRIVPNFGSDVVRGLLIGFTRDVRITKGLPAESNDNLNYTSSTSFFIAPTQSLDASTIGFINKSDVAEEGNCFATFEPFCFKKLINEPLSENNNLSFSAITSSFCHVAITLNPIENLLSVYLDGSLIGASAINLVFPVSQRQMPKVPSWIQANSLQYAAISLSNAPEYCYGIEPVKYTPWVIGGGYTDAFPNGNFLGGQYGGQRSGLNGYLGSFKFYNKYLTSDEVLNNYEAQKSFFKNIQI